MLGTFKEYNAAGVTKAWRIQVFAKVRAEMIQGSPRQHKTYAFTLNQTGSPRRLSKQWLIRLVFQ